MEWYQLFITFLMALFTFNVNHRIKRYLDIKIIINSLFELYGQVNSFKINDTKDVNHTLMNEIVGLEKMHDDNFYARIQINKLRKLRLMYFEYNENTTDEELISRLKEINFRKLDRSFIILSFFNIKLVV